MNYLRITIVIFLLLVHSSLQAKIYQCVDEKGKTTYKDTKCDDNQSLVEIKTFSESAIVNYKQNKKNLLKNSNFDNALEHWQTDSKKEWTSSFGIANVKSKSKKTSQLAQCVNVTNNIEFKIGARLNNPSPYIPIPNSTIKAPTSKILVLWFDEDNCQGAAVMGAEVHPTDSPGWQIIEQKKLYTTLKTKSGLVQLVNWDPFSRSESVLWDDIYLEPTKKSSPIKDNTTEKGLLAQVNLLLNSEFDNNIDGWRRGGWQAVWDSQEGHLHQGAVKIIASSDNLATGMGALTQCVTIDGQQNLKLSAVYKSAQNSSQTGGIRLRATWFENNNCSGRYEEGKSVKDKGSENWKQLELVDLVKPASASSVMIDIIQGIDGKGEFITYWDNIRLELSKD